MLLVQACHILQRKGKGSLEALQMLYGELVKYKNGEAPYDSPFPSGLSLVSWWRALELTTAGCLLRLVALHVAFILPHSADTERMFSLMGWYHSARRNRLGHASVTAMTKIKMYHGSKDSSVRYCL